MTADDDLDEESLFAEEQTQVHAREESGSQRERKRARLLHEE
jgi:hypothetical protein